MSNPSYDAISVIDKLYFELWPDAEKAMCILNDLIDKYFSKKDELRDEKDKFSFEYNYKEIATKIGIVSDYVFSIKKLEKEVEKFFANVSGEEDNEQEHE